MNRRTYIWKVGGLAFVMVAIVIWLFGCSRESIEDAMEEGALSAPLIHIAVSSLSSFPTSTTIPVYDSKNKLVGTYYVELTWPDDSGGIPPSNEWCYYVEELSGRSLSHWVFAVECLVTPDNHIVSTSPPGTIGKDGSTGYWGVKWDLPEAFTSGEFCIYLDGIYDVDLVNVVVKTGGGYGVGTIAGPSCEIIQHNGVEQGTGGTP